MNLALAEEPVAEREQLSDGVLAAGAGEHGALVGLVVGVDVQVHQRGSLSMVARAARDDLNTTGGPPGTGARTVPGARSNLSIWNRARRQPDDLMCLALPNHSIEGNEAMYVCICRAVPETVVRGCIAEGARTVRDVVRRSEAGTGCGTCLGKIIALLGAYAEELDNTLRHSA